MKTETKEIYKCDFCKKLYQIRRFAELHEKFCSKNPDNDRKCFWCKYFKKKKVVIYCDSSNGEYDFERNLELFYCDKIDSFIYPPKVEHKGNSFDLNDDSNEPMRRECDEYEKPVFY